MITRVVMPKLSEAMETGKVIQWLKKEGEPVKGGDVIAEIETDKANVEIEAFGSGVLRKILVGPGGQVPVGEMIAVIADPAEDISGVASAPSPPKPAASPAPAPSATAAAIPAMETYQSAPATTRVVPLTGAVAPAGGAAPAAPPPAGATAATARPAFVIPPRPGAEYNDVALSPMRAAIAKRMPLSKAPVPHFYVTTEVAMDRAWALRADLNALEGQPKVSVNDLIIKACALALLRNPGVNASFQGAAIRVHHRAHIGIAVSLDQGLITPVLRDCDVKPLGQIAVESRDLAERARGGRLRAQEMTGATFSISNLGMFDVDEFSAIINPPEGAILAVGSVVEKPVVEDGEVRVGRRMKLTVSCDHRVMDGAMGARFLQDVKRLLQEPLRLLV